MRRYHHIGIPTSQSRPGERQIADLDIFVVGHDKRIMTKQQLNAAEASVSEWQRQHQPQAEKLAVASSAQREAQSSKRANGPVRPR